MSFTAYAATSDVEHYIPGATRDLWQHDATEVASALAKAARQMNERLGGLDRFATSSIPMAVEDDGAYAEVLIQLNVYEAVLAKVMGTHAGENLDHWRTWIIRKNHLWDGIESGRYRFGAEPAVASGSKTVTMGRSSL